MATTISTQDIVDAKRDIDDIGKAVNEKVIVSPRYGGDFKSLPLLSDEAQSSINGWDEAIRLITQEEGVPALAVSDASGVTQQKINDGLESIAELRNTNPTRKGLRVYVKSWHEGLALGGGIFVATQKAGLADNGVTVFSSQNPLIFWVRANVREVTPFMAGAKGDRVQDDQPAFMAALATGFPVKAEKPPVGYRLNAPVSLSDAQVLEGDKERIDVYVDHVGACFKLTKSCTLKNFSPRPFNSAREYNFDGLEVGESGSLVSFTFNNIDNIKPFFPRNGFVLRGWVFWNTFLNIDCYKFRDNGILLANDTEDKNNNYFQFKQLSSNAQVESDGSYKFLDVTWEQCAIRVKGNQNIFVGGEHAPSKWGVWIDGVSSGNRFQSMYGEHQLHPIKTFAGSENFYDSTCAQGTPQIHPDSIIYGQSGKDNTRYARLGIAPIAAQKELKALWFFNEGRGNKIVDRSGNGKHLTVVNPIWTNDGRWGSTIKLDTARTTRFNDLPTNILDWEQPFTLAACVKSPEAGTNFLITFRDSDQRYAALSTGQSLASITDSNLATITTTSYTRMLRSPQDGYVWVILYFDPVNKTLTALDPERGVVDTRIPSPPVFSPWISGGGKGISTITLGSRTTAGLDGSFSFLGLWQRRLNMSEVSDLVNMKVPNLFPSAAPAVVSNQADSTATDVNTLKADFNALLAKMRDAGIML